MECADYHLGAASNGSKVSLCKLSFQAQLFVMTTIATAPTVTVIVWVFIVTTVVCLQVILSAPSDELRNLWIMALSIAGVTRSFRFWAKKEVSHLP